MNKLKDKIQDLSVGGITWVGNDYTLEEMKNIYSFLVDLEKKGTIRIDTVHRESKTGNRYIDLVKIEKL